MGINYTSRIGIIRQEVKKCTDMEDKYSQAYIIVYSLEDGGIEMLALFPSGLETKNDVSVKSSSRLE
jgi:hypothetical protein